jgi:hypothetical protein
MRIRSLSTISQTPLNFNFCKMIMCGVPVMGVPPNHPFELGFFNYKPIKPFSYWGTSIIRKPSCGGFMRFHPSDDPGGRIGTSTD